MTTPTATILNAIRSLFGRDARTVESAPPAGARTLQVHTGDVDLPDIKALAVEHDAVVWGRSGTPPGTALLIEGCGGVRLRANYRPLGLGPR